MPAARNRRASKADETTTNLDPDDVGGLRDETGDPVGEAPGELKFTSDGRVVTRPEFGGPGNPAEEGSVELFVHDASRVPAPRPISQDVVEEPAETPAEPEEGDDAEVDD